MQESIDSDGVIEVFLCAVNDGPLRSAMRHLSLVRWSMEPSAMVVLTTPMLVGCDESEFQSARRIYADENSVGDLYIVADDDCMPVTPGFISRGIKLMSKHTNYAMLCMYPQTTTEWHSPHFIKREDDDIEEHCSVGGIRFCRKGALVVWPEHTSRGYDRKQCEALNEEGWKVGYFRNLKMNHLGEGFSTVWSPRQVQS